MVLIAFASFSCIQLGGKAAIRSTYLSAPLLGEAENYSDNHQHFKNTAIPKPTPTPNMAALSPKRRKLEHDSSEESASRSDDQRSDSEDGGQSHEEQSTLAAPAVKRKRPQVVQGQDVDESALYSGGLYKSSMFKLQVDEMLAEVRPREKHFAGIDQALHKLNSLIEGIENREILPVS